MMDLVKELNEMNYEAATEHLKKLGFEENYSFDDRKETVHDEDWSRGEDKITFTCELIISEDKDILNRENGYWNIEGLR